MTNDSEYVIVGKIGATFGIKGWLKIISYTEALNDLFEYKSWYLEEGKSFKPIQFTAGQEHGKGLIAHLEGIDTPEDARLLTGKTIAVKRDQLAKLPENEFYWKDIEGLTVINADGEELGKVIYIIATGTNDVLVVKGAKEHAIPYLLNDVVTSIDLEKKIMHVNWEVL